MKHSVSSTTEQELWKDKINRSLPQLPLEETTKAANHNKVIVDLQQIKKAKEFQNHSQPSINLIEVVEVAATLCSMEGHKTDHIQTQEDGMFVTHHIEPKNAPIVQQSRRHQEEPTHLHDLPYLQ